ncbi:MAG: hypothetical protein JO168_24105 [Solirubrobacterales bacterium]|nr:hypothetical protein [Solirubrobacterales bacterium]MBV9714691.1 hypothetical protein [Solirubrobacterales bacterium]
MSTVAPRPAAFELRTLAARPSRTDLGGRVKLCPSADGWSLVGTDGRLLFGALGPHGRRQCLEYARARGVLVVLS